MLHDFDICLSTRCIFGKDVERTVGTVLAADGAKKVMVVHGDGTFLKESGILDNVFADLTAAGLEYVDFGGVRPEPLLSHCAKGIEIFRREGCNYLLGIGGGSTIDAAKGISAGVTYDGPFADMFSKPCFDLSRKPHVAVIVTMASTGSETGFGAVIYDDSKPGMLFSGAIQRTNKQLRPNIAFMNPALTATVPPYQTMCGIVDMFSHVCERYITLIDYGVIDYVSEGAMRAIVDFGQKVIQDPNNLEARGELLWAANLAHNDTCGVGRTMDFGAHGCGSALGSMYHIPHGATLSIVMASWMRRLYKDHIDRFVRYATEVWHVPYNDADPEGVALEGIRRTEQWFKRLGAPTSFREANIPTNNLEEVAKIACKDGPVGRVFKLGYDDVFAIIKDAASL